MSVDDRENIIQNEIKEQNNNNTIYSYKKDLWMYFESINSRFLKERQKVKSLMYIFLQKSIFSEEYGQNLDLLYNQVYTELSYFVEIENSTKNNNKNILLDDLYNIFLENIKNESLLYKKYSKSIKNNLNKLEQNINIQFEMNSHLNELFKTYQLQFKKVIQNVKDFKEKYENSGKLVEKSKKEYEIMKEEIESQKEINEADNLKYKKCKEENKQKLKEAKKRQKNYEDYLVIANKEREKYIELSEKIYDLAQKLDNEYIELVKNNINIFLNSESDLNNKIITENKNILKNVELINFNWEIEQFANSKFPKFSLPKPFIYEQYNPYLFLRERRTKDHHTENKEIYKIIVNDLNHLFLSEKYKLNISNDNTNNQNDENNKNANKTKIEDIDYIRNSVHDIWNSKKIDFYKIKNLLINDELRIIFLREINQYRNEGIFILDQTSYDNLAKSFNILINISYDIKDYESIKACMILSQTFYESSDKKISLQKEIYKNEVWKKPGFWEEFIDFSIKHQINYSKGYLEFLEEDEEKREERVKNCVNSELITFSYNMNLFKVPHKEIKEIVESFLKKYGINDNTILDSQLEVSEIEDEIITESLASNLIVEPIEEEEKKNEE